jgi:hypothetical protein
MHPLAIKSLTIPTFRCICANLRRAARASPPEALFKDFQSDAAFGESVIAGWADLPNGKKPN